jgi:hypothetical protein
MFLHWPEALSVATGSFAIANFDEMALGPLTLCFDAIPKGKRYALFPGKPFHTFPGIALGSSMDMMGSMKRRAGAT